LSDELLKEFEEIKTRKMKNYQLLFEKRNLEGNLET
jgi:hypothetical protein